MTAKVAEQIGCPLGDGKARLATVARAPAMSCRCLQGALKAEGAAYQANLDEVCEQLAAAYFEDGRPSLAEIPFQLLGGPSSRWRPSLEGASPLHAAPPRPCYPEAASRADPRG